MPSNLNKNTFEDHMEDLYIKLNYLNIWDYKIATGRVVDKI